MEERPSLPDTDDPFELLGVARSADARDIKRAYVRLIKRYRPEVDPEAFQRIRAAYEIACEQDAFIDVPEIAASPRECAHAAPPALDDPDEPAAWRWQGSDDELFAALSAGTPVPPDALWGETREALDRVLLREGLSWATLARQPHRGVALSLLDRRLQLLAVEGRLAELADESEAALDPARVLDEPDLEPVVLRRLPAALWEHPAQVERLFGRYRDALASQAIDEPLSIYEQLGAIAEAWARFAPRAPVPRELERFLRLAVVVDHEVLAPAAAELGDRLRREPEAVMRVLVDLRGRAEGLFFDVLDLLADAAPWWQPSMEELSDAEIDELRLTMLDLNRALKPRPFGAIIAVAALAGVLAWPVYATNMVIGALVVYGVLWFIRQDRLYPQIVRPRLIELAARYGTAPSHVLRRLDQAPREGRRVRNLIPAIDADEVLGWLAQLGRMLHYFEAPGEGDDPDES